MRLIWVVLFLAFDLYALTMFQLGGAPPGEGIEAEAETTSWYPSGLLEEGNHFGYEVSGPEQAVGLDLDAVGVSDYGFTFQVLAEEGGIRTEGEMVVRSSDLLASGSREASAIWNAYVRHPALPSFRENALRMGANWSYTSEDGYLASVMVSSKERMLGYEGFVCEIRGRRTLDRVYIAPQIPLPVRHESDIGSTSPRSVSSLVEWY